MKLLFLTSRFPYPLEKGDKLRAFELIKHLSNYHEIILFAVNDQPVTNEQLARLKPYCKEIHTSIISPFQSYVNLALNIFSERPFSVAYFFSNKTAQLLNAVIEKTKPDLAFCHLIRMSEYIRKRKDFVKVLDYMDAFSAGMERMRGKSNLFISSFAAIEHKRLLKYESDVLGDFDKQLIISEQDRQLIRHNDSDKIKVIPNGVDFDFFKPKTESKKYDLLFAGNMNYPPNIQSVTFIINEVLPVVRKKFPQIKMVVAGANPSSEILKLNLDNVEVTGWVEDIREYFYQSKVMLAPMLISIGLQNKILQAMAMKTPCIISTLANNAIGAVNGREAIIADSAEEIAHAIAELLNNELQRNQLSEKAYAFVNKNYDWKNIAADLNELITDNSIKF